MQQRTALLLLFLSGLGLLTAAAGQSPSQQYQLRVELDDAALEAIHAAGQEVVLARQPAPGAWFTVFGAFRPFEHNYVQWNNTGYGLYAAKAVPLVERAVIFETTFTQPIMPGFLYTLQADGVFSGAPLTGVTLDEFAVRNAYGQPLVFGLSQDVNINNRWTLRAPLAATELLSNEHDLFAMDPTLHVFLAPRGLVTGTVASDLFEIAESDVTTLPFRSSSSHVVQWDSQLGRFIRLQ